MIAAQGGTNSPAVDVPFTVIPVGDASVRPVDYGAGFPVAPGSVSNQLYDGPGTDLWLNGDSAAAAHGVPGMFDPDGDGLASLRLTSQDNGEAVSVYSAEKVSILGWWTNQFDFRLSATGDAADGFVFVLQNKSDRFVGGGGGGGGYDGIGSKAIGIGFDTYNAHSLTGAFLGDTGPISNDEGNDPYVSGVGYNHGVNLNPGGSGVDLQAGHRYRAVINYDGTGLSEMVLDLDDAGRMVFNYNYGSVDLRQVLGGDDAWIGFSAATGGLNEQVDILNWIYSKPIVDPSPPFPPTFTLNDGAAQRSAVTSLTVTFPQPVTLAPGALKLIRDLTDAGGATTGVTADISSALSAPTSGDGGITWKWTFVAGTADTEASASLTDGVYHVVVDHTKVSNGFTTMSSDYIGPRFHRLFGDVNGNRTVNLQDYGQLRIAFGKSAGQTGFNAAFDFDGSGVINTLDYGQFRRRFGSVLSYT